MSNLGALFEDFREKFKNQDEIFKEYSEIFRKFWKEYILNDRIETLDDSDIDPIIRLIDMNAKGNNKNSISIAKAFIRMGQWYRAFHSLKTNNDIKNCLTKIFNSENDDDLTKYLDEFDQLNKNLKNGLTGKNANILNGLLCLYNPSYYISALSLDHRNRMVNYFCGKDVSEESFGKKIIYSNRIILDYFKSKNIIASPRTISCFIYSIKNIWDSTIEPVDGPTEGEIDNEEQVFVLEKYFEDFLVGNWETTDLGKKYSLVYSEDGELLSQQYKTDIGKIDLLVKEKNTENYVVIELKRNQTSDDTVGQILRYMGWVKEKLANGNLVKGVIICYSKDEKLFYALKAVPNIELFYYRINFNLIEAK